MNKEEVTCDSCARALPFELARVTLFPPGHGCSIQIISLFPPFQIKALTYKMQSKKPRAEVFPLVCGLSPGAVSPSSDLHTDSTEGDALRFLLHRGGGFEPRGVPYSVARCTVTEPRP